MEDDYGESLYFRGDVNNNYVKFGQDKNDYYMYLRIVRINGDGSLRLIYDRTEPHENGESSNDRTKESGDLRYGRKSTTFEAWDRLYGGIVPSLICSRKQDSFTGKGTMDEPFMQVSD